MMYITFSMSYDILERILSTTNVGYLNKTTILFEKVLSYRDRKNAVDSILNPFLYLSKLTPHPQRLLKLMRDYKIVIGGSRATGYFYPNVCTKSSDWDFHCINDIKSVYAFITEMESIGCVFKYSIQSDPNPINIGWYAAQTISIRSILDGTIPAQDKRLERRIQLIVTGYDTNIGHIMSYCTSATQCMITGFHAVSFHHCISKDNNAVEWTHERNSESKELRSLVPLALSKLKSRGIEFIPCTEYFTLMGISLNERYTNFHKRLIGDKYCKIIEFNKYDSGIPAPPPLPWGAGLCQYATNIQFWLDIKFQPEYHDNSLEVLGSSLVQKLRYEAPITTQYTALDKRKIEVFLKKLLVVTEIEFNDKICWLANHVCLLRNRLDSSYPF